MSPILKAASPLRIKEAGTEKGSWNNNLLASVLNFTFGYGYQIGKGLRFPDCHIS